MDYLPCSPGEACPLYYKGGCPTEDIHHEYYPASEYTSQLDKIFRNLPENKIEVCRALHNEIHAREKPPEKPSKEEMIKAIGESAVSLSKSKLRVVEAAKRSLYERTLQV